MIHNHRAPTAVSWLLAALLSTGPVGCGSDDDPMSGPPPAVAGATVVAVADAATVAWNAPSVIDVLANDSASSGTLVLSAVGAGAHGSAAIVGGKLSYTPAAGYFGDDTLTYTVQATDGGATQTASVRISVSAAMQFKGVASDAPLAGAGVVVTVGTQTFNTTADANGRFSVNIATATPSAPVLVTAIGIGAQSNVKLISLAGEAATLAKLAAPNGDVDSAVAPALNATHFSTALAALVTEANGGVMPTTQARLDELSAQVSLEKLVDLATAIWLVADQGVALPAGVADTLALVSNPGTSAPLAAFIAAQLPGGDPTAFSNARTQVLAAVVPSASPPALAVGGPQTYAYFQGGRVGGAHGEIITYRPDGTASVSNALGTREASWSAADGAITLTFATPYSEFWFTLPDVNQDQWEDRYDTTGYVLRQVSGDAAGGAVLIVQIGTTTRLDGPDAGKVMPFDGNGVTASALLRSVDLAQTLALTAADFATGVMWAGVGSDSSDANGLNRGYDVLEVTGPGTARLVREGSTLTWAIAGNWFVVTGPGVERRYARVERGAIPEAEHWLMVESVAGVVQSVSETLMVQAVPGEKFKADATSYRRWGHPFNLSDSTALNGTSFYDVYADGTAASESVYPGQSPDLSPLSWAIDIAGDLTFTYPANRVSTRSWHLLRRTAGGVFVMEHRLSQNSFEFWRVQIYSDDGPAVH